VVVRWWSAPLNGVPIAEACPQRHGCVAIAMKFPPNPRVLIARIQYGKTIEV
jgi:hypothetical protein